MNLGGKTSPKRRNEDADDAEGGAKEASEWRCVKGTKDEPCGGHGPAELSEVARRKLLKGRECEDGMGAAAAAGCVKEAAEARESAVRVAAGDVAEWQEAEEEDEVVRRAVDVIEGSLDGGDGEGAGGMAVAMEASDEVPCTV